MIEWGVLALAGLLFLTSIGGLFLMLKEFTYMKTCYVLMEEAFKKHKESVEDLHSGIRCGFEASDERYGEVCRAYSDTKNDNNALQERINKMEAKVKQPLNPDITYN